MKQFQLWVVVPCYNEAKGIYRTVEALAAQQDKAFRLLFVNNGSTDQTARVIRQTCSELSLPFEIVDEPQKGTGAAADTGFRYAIDHGATHIARTDADTSPATDWIVQIKAGFDSGLLFMGGSLRLRHDDITPTWLDKLFVPFMLWIGITYGKFFYRGRQFKYTFFMAAGNNMSIERQLYLRAGGFKRISIAEGKEDSMLAETVRTMTTRAAWRPRMVVYTSIRRVRTYGYINTLRWYSDRHFTGKVDIR